MLIKRQTLLGVLLAGALAIPGHATAVPLSDLFAGGTIIVLDKLFSEWTLITETTVGDASADPEDIEVTGIESPGNPGIRFTGSVEANGALGAASATLVFSFEVSTLSGEPLINGNSLLLTDFMFDAGPLPTAAIAIGEAVFGPSDVVPLALKAVFATSEDSPDQGDPDHSDDADFAPQSSVRVVKTIEVEAGLFDLAVLEQFEQRFSQLESVPEPATLALLGIALAGLGVSRRKRGARRLVRR